MASFQVLHFLLVPFALEAVRKQFENKTAIIKLFQFSLFDYRERRGKEKRKNLLICDFKFLFLPAFTGGSLKCFCTPDLTRNPRCEYTCKRIFLARPNCVKFAYLRVNGEDKNLMQIVLLA